MSDEELKKVANEVRKGIVTGVHAAKSGHPGGSLGAADIMTYLYFEEMNVDPADPRKADRDRFVLSKGHCAPGLYAVLAERGFFPKEDLETLRQTDFAPFYAMADLPAAMTAHVVYTAIDPDLPFAYWDVGDFSRQFGGAGANGDAGKQLAHYRAVVAGHEKFLEVAARGPVARYFYRPQYQADYDDLARSQLQSARSMVESSEKMAGYLRASRGQTYEDATRRMRAMGQGGKSQ